MSEKRLDDSPVSNPNPRMRFLIGRVLLIAGLVFIAGAITFLFVVKIEDRVTARGLVLSRDHVEVRALGEGLLSDLLCRDGDQVKKGQILGRLVDTVIREKLSRQEEAVRRAAAELDIAQRELEKLQKDPLPEKLRFTGLDLKQARVKRDAARVELERVLMLRKQGIASQREVDNQQKGFDLAKADLEKAQGKRRIVQQGLGASILAEAQAKLKLTREKADSSRAELARLRRQLDRSTLRAPEAGKLVMVTKRPGEAVKPGELVFAIAASEEIDLHVYVDEENILKVAPGQPARVISSVFSYVKYGYAEGLVTEVATSARQQEGVPRYRVKIHVTHTPQPLRLGSTATAYIIIARRSIISLLLDRAVS